MVQENQNINIKEWNVMYEIGHYQWELQYISSKGKKYFL